MTTGIDPPVIQRHLGSDDPSVRPKTRRDVLLASGRTSRSNEIVTIDAQDDRPTEVHARSRQTGLEHRDGGPRTHAGGHREEREGGSAQLISRRVKGYRYRSPRDAAIDATITSTNQVIATTGRARIPTIRITATADTSP